MAAQKSLRVLIVDDEKDIIDVLLLRFRAQGAFTVETASDGEAALEKAKAFRPDVVLLDLLMPGLDGWELCQRLRSEPETAKTPIVVMTAGRSDQDRERARALGIQRMLFKPFDDRLLIRLLREVAEAA